MNPIRLTTSQAQAIRDHGVRAFPHECCGFVLGKEEEGRRAILHVIPALNSRGQEEMHNRFTITPEAWMRAERQAREAGLDIVGCYHSHPNAPARPSAYDLEHAWPWISYLIVSIMAGEAVDLNSWLLDDDRSRFNQQMIEIQDS